MDETPEILMGNMQQKLKAEFSFENLYLIYCLLVPSCGPK